MIEKYRLHNLHAIRGWAMLFVVIGHAKYPFWSGGNAYLEKFPRDQWGGSLTTSCLLLIC